MGTQLHRPSPTIVQFSLQSLSTSTLFRQIFLLPPMYFTTGIPTGSLNFCRWTSEFVCPLRRSWRLINYKREPRRARVNFLQIRSMVRKSDLYFNKNVFPTRVIDVPATINSEGVHFSVPKDWDFHMISHTWTDTIDSLLDQITAVVTKTGWTVEKDPDGSIYNQLFTNNELAGEHYDHVLHYLRCLAADGVKKIWLDVLCINQNNKDEKSHEMLYMGGYYYFCAGCYVVPHGLGTPSGFKPLTVDSSLPRWLSRVWTLQESVLPQNLRVIVEKFDDEIIEYLKSEDCDAADKQWIDWDAKLHETGPGDHARIKIKHEDQSSELYFLGAKAYYEMMHTLLTVRVIYKEETLPELPIPRFYAEFHDIAGGEKEIDVESVVKQLRVRNSKEEEDRIMGTLGLMGLKGEEYTLTTGLTLDEHMVQLAQLLLKDNPQFLINMCAADYEGHGTPGISWAPDVKAGELGTRQEFRRYFVDYVVVRKHVAIAKEVGEDGSLVLEAKALKAILERVIVKSGGGAANKVRYRLKIGGHKVDLRHDVEEEGGLLLHPEGMKDIAEGGHWKGGLLVPAPGIDKLKGYGEELELPICEVRLLLLGFDIEAGKEHKRICALLVGVPLDDEAKILQKIGLLHPVSAYSRSVEKLFSATKPSSFSIAGIGTDLSPHLSPSLQALLKTFTTTTTTTTKA